MWWTRTTQAYRKAAGIAKRSRPAEPRSDGQRACHLTAPGQHGIFTAVRATLAQSAEQALRKRQVSSSTLEGGFFCTLDSRGQQNTPDALVRHEANPETATWVPQTGDSTACSQVWFSRFYYLCIHPDTPRQAVPRQRM